VAERSTSRIRRTDVRLIAESEREPTRAGSLGDGDRLRGATTFDTPPITIEVGRDTIEEIVASRKLALTQVYNTLDVIRDDLKNFFPAVPQIVPSRLEGQLVNPDGSPGATLSVEVQKPSYSQSERVGAFSWPEPRAITDGRGVFSVALPAVPIPEKGLALRVRGGNDVTKVTVPASNLIDEQMGLEVLDRTLTPLPGSIVSELKDIVPAGAADVELRPEDFATPAPMVMLGEGDCARSFRSNTGVIDRFRYSLLIRLIEPEVTPRQLVLRTKGTGNRYIPLTYRMAHRESIDGAIDESVYLGELADRGTWAYTERVPVEVPIDVTSFRQRLEQFPTRVPKGGTLALGYLVTLRQTWIPAGLSLGDLLYSLALAPGEQQRVAVHERTETLSVRDVETLSVDEAQRFQEATDQSTHAVFDSAFRESASGGSRMHTSSDSGGIGLVGGIGGMVAQGVLAGVGISAGYGAASSSGSTSSWQQGSRDFVSNASQDFHASLARSSALTRRVSRTGVRLATASERDSVTTKVISNHNHCHALTVQYWEVLRHYAVSSEVDDVQLVCYVPLELIEWLPQDVTRDIPTSPTREDLLHRYRMLIRYHDVLLSRMWWNAEYRHGLTLLKNFAADPTVAVQSSDEPADDVVDISISGTFVPFEHVYVSMVTRNGLRIGPVRLTGPVSAVSMDTYSSRAELIQYLRGQRSDLSGTTLKGKVYLPGSIARSDIVRFEFSRRFEPFSYRVKFDLSQIGSLNLFDLARFEIDRNIAFSTAELERDLGGPLVWSISAKITADNQTFVDALTGSEAAERMPSSFPFPARRVVSELSYADLLRIEGVFQHVWQNAVDYSKTVWQSLTAEERAIMLEPFTIGVPKGGASDATDETPLLNCVANRIIGFFGNAMVMPFHIPPSVAASMAVTTRDVQNALLRFHRQAFAPPRSSVTLPTHGMLGEAVLGGCDSCEKIDLTRFWDWTKATVDTAEAITPEQLKPDRTLISAEGAVGPAKLAEQQSVGSQVNIGAGALPAPSSNLLAEMISKMPAPTQFTDITGMTSLQKQLEETLKQAGTARKEAVETAKGAFEKVIDNLDDVIKAEAEGRETAKAAQEKEKEKADGSTKAKVDLLGSNIAFFVDKAGAEANDASAESKAVSLVASLFEGILPSMDKLLPVYDKLKPAQGDSPATIRGKSALLKALGL
jgi:hypothetical protein